MRANTASLKDKGFFERRPYPPDPENETAAPAGPRNGGIDREALTKALDIEDSAAGPAWEWPLAFADEVQALRAEFYSRAGESIGSPDYLAFVRSLPMDYATLASHAGFVAVLPIGLRADRSFYFADEGMRGVVLECLGEDADTIVDLLAWPLHRPEKFATALHRADALGVSQVSNTATYFGGTPLRVHRTPLGWLQAGCSGCVPLNPVTAPEWLGWALGNILADDVDHGREISRMVGHRIDPTRILAPVRRAA